MITPPSQGLYRTTVALPGREQAIPARCLVFVGERAGGARFVVRPQQNRQNTWFWHEPTIELPPSATAWAQTLRALPSEGFYTLPEDLHLGGGGLWLRHAIVQLGYNGEGQGILFIAERREGAEDNALHFKTEGVLIGDALLDRLVWAPILPVPQVTAPSAN